MPSPPRHIVSLLTSHGITPHVGHAIAHAPKNQARASPLHYVEGIPGVSWPTSVPIQGQRLRNRKLGKVVGDNEIGGAYTPSGWSPYSMSMRHRVPSPLLSTL
ncbi:hypothetical protein B0H14DRAFT_3454918 [Mycena olivaceomarginata]|nr:hypothetical protein B0H14DRAFT_3454918 [Mycena olivaceomarginata]